METGVHGRIGIHVQRHVVVDQGHDIMNVTVQSLYMGIQPVKESCRPHSKFAVYHDFTVCGHYCANISKRQKSIRIFVDTVIHFERIEPYKYGRHIV
jgi:hypothetical protein